MPCKIYLLNSGHGMAPSACRDVSVEELFKDRSIRLHGNLGLEIMSILNNYCEKPALHYCNSYSPRLVFVPLEPNAKVFNISKPL